MRILLFQSGCQTQPAASVRERERDRVGLRFLWRYPCGQRRRSSVVIGVEVTTKHIAIGLCRTKKPVRSGHGGF
ncbi:hypothetical protein HanIR_Chr17g0853381 [Helianthus annuus]|nr:hypothetical protein HanIR_Chr17g0853381 [Helianthus annuus]